MKRVGLAILLVMLDACGGASSRPPAVAARDDANERVADATKVAHDADIPLVITKNARCIAIIPDLLHVGLVLGGRAGRGVVTCRHGNGEGNEWTVPSFFTMNGASAGFAAGVESVDLVMLVMTSAGEDELLRGRLRISTAASVTGGVGRNAELGSDIALAVPILYYSRSKGLFVGLDLSGTVLERDEEATRAFYGDSRDFGVLLRAPAAPPPLVAPFQSAVAGMAR